MDKPDWKNEAELKRARRFFDLYVVACNPRDAANKNNITFRSPLDDPCLLETTEMLSVQLVGNYEETTEVFQ